MKEADILEKTYYDRADVYTISQSEDEYGITRQERTKKYDNIKCSLSKKSISSLNKDTNTNTISIKHVLFTSDKIHIKPADIVHITNKNIYFKAGESFCYPSSHTELILSISEDIGI